MPSQFPVLTVSTQRLLNALDVHHGGTGVSPALWAATDGVWGAGALLQPPP
jgi:hypothetical protein